ncbi:hypothetical protein Tco_0621861 [Tanacetum coccineum]
MEQFVKQLKETDFSSVIHDSITSQVPSIVDKYLRSSLPDSIPNELQANIAVLKKELSELNYKEVIKESVKAHVVKEVKNFLPLFLAKAVSDFATPIIEEFSEMEQFVKQLKETDFSSVIHDSITSQVPSIVDKYLGSSLPNSIPNELQANNAVLKKELSELNYKEVIKESVKAHVAVNEDVIEESVKAHVVNEDNNFLPQFLPKAVSKFSKPMLQDAIAKSPIPLAQSSSSHQLAIQAAKSLSELELKQIHYDKILNSGSSCSHQTHEELFNALTWSIKLDESRSTQSTKPDLIPKKRDCGDDDKDGDPSARSNQGKPPSKPSKSRKSRSANDVVEETIFEMGSDDVDQTFDKKADNSEQPSPDANTKQPSPAIAANPKRQKNDWYKKSPKKVNAVVPPLTFDELMSTPIDFLTFTMNHLRLTTLTREVLVGHVFNLLKGYDHPHIGKPLPLIEKDGRLTISVEVLFNNDLEYLKGDKAKRTYYSSITKMPAARYTMEGIDDLIPNLWCSRITAYDKDALLGIKHYRSQRQQFYRAMINKTSKHKVFSKLRILSVISVTVDKKWGYGYLKEIVVKRADQKHYTFKKTLSLRRKCSPEALSFRTKLKTSS